MSLLISGIGVIALLLTVLFIVIFIKKRKKKADINLPYVLKGTAGAQEEYEKKFLDDIKLTIQEKIELSWQFLYDITEYILNKFSNADRETVHQLGAKLLQNGMRYEHVVDYALKIDTVMNKKKFTEQEVNTNQTQVGR